jgi:hypothetical protein
MKRKANMTDEFVIPTGRRTVRKTGLDGLAHDPLNPNIKVRPRHIGFLEIDDKSDVGKLLHKIVRNSISAVDAGESRKA